MAAPEEDFAGILSPIQRLKMDAARAASLSTGQARWFVDAYYQIQDFRIQSANQYRQGDETDQKSEFLGWMLSQMGTLETHIQRELGRWAKSHPAGEWAQSITGIGPVISAGLVAHIDISVCPTVGHIWRFAGLDPTVKWGKGEKRPWNAKLKVLCWKIGDSFVKQKSRESDVYGKIYETRKKLELERNEAGIFADQAALALEERNIKDATLRATYENGKLPLGRLELRARRYATKLFLSHYHWVAYENYFKQPVPLPYVIAHIPGHVHIVEPPNYKPLPRVA